MEKELGIFCGGSLLKQLGQNVRAPHTLLLARGDNHVLFWIMAFLKNFAAIKVLDLQVPLHSLLNVTVNKQLNLSFRLLFSKTTKFSKMASSFLLQYAPHSAVVF